MRAGFLALLSLLIVGPFQAPAPAASPDHYAQLRAIQKDGEAIIAEGMARSATFRRLADRLEGSDVIVYVDIRPDMRTGVGGSLRFVGMSTTHRFLRIQLNRAGSHEWLVALLGHELQHAIEVVEAPDVRSAADLGGLYRRIGVPIGPDTFDSVAARQAGYTVRHELTMRPTGLGFAKVRPEPDPVSAGESLGEDAADQPASPVSF